MSNRHPKLLLQEYTLSEFGLPCMYKLDETHEGLWKPSVVVGDKIYTTTELFASKREATDKFSEELYNRWTKTSEVSFTDIFLSEIKKDIPQEQDTNTISIKIYTMDSFLSHIEKIKPEYKDLIELHNKHPFTHWQLVEDD